MIRSRNLTVGWAGCILLGLMLVACDEPTATEVSDSPPVVEVVAPQLNMVALSAMPQTPVQCPTTHTLQGSGLITPRGGTVTVGKNSVRVPAGAVKQPTWITMTLPASEYLMVDLRANGREHFEFSKEIEVTIDYSHCGTQSDAVYTGERAVWYLDESAGVPSEAMRSTNRADQVTFRTDHFSAYMVCD